MLSEHLTITGITTLCQLHDINDPEFWQDFSDDKDIQIAVVRKSAELLQIMQKKLDENELYYATFSKRVKEVLNQFEQGQIQGAETLKKYEQIIRDMQASLGAHTNTSLNQKAYGILKILEAFQNEDNIQLEATAQAIDALYTSEAPSGWQLKEQLRKQLRQQVRTLVFKLGLSNWKDIPAKVEEYAIKHY
ncbi:hypothetical protein DSM106972_016340 [Dulcicalothrix desertica PCC 7102]|uniref:Type I restriction enzyme HindI endonuclease subunit-like C-terminal domain-containing protein n=2 Tax=Dulcicalothrix desertica TaxID=32056 RepID=A0A433VQT3_9CYAN|nr:hypothetical protein DSM106972_016340 [Dulcicalothrix desertica PCC 7102]